jgi:hypothetical protein
MATQKMSKSERAQLDAAVETLRRALADGEQSQKEDDECMKAAAAESNAAAVKAIVAGGTGDARTATARGVLAIRERGGNRISDTVYRDRK